MHGGALLVRSMRSTGLSSSHLVCGIVSGCRPCATAGSAYGETLSRVVTLAATSPHGGACGTPVPVPPQQPGQPSAAFSTGSNHRASDGESSSSPATAHSSAISAAAGGAATDDDGSPRARPEVCGRPSTYAHGLTHDHVSWVRHVLEDAEEELRARQRIVQHEARQAQLREAQASGLRVVVDCGFIHETAVNDKEVGRGGTWWGGHAGPGGLCNAQPSRPAHVSSPAAGLLLQIVHACVNAGHLGRHRIFYCCLTTQALRDDVRGWLPDRTPACWKPTGHMCVHAACTSTCATGAQPGEAAGALRRSQPPRGAARVPPRDGVPRTAAGLFKLHRCRGMAHDTAPGADDGPLPCG